MKMKKNMVLALALAGLVMVGCGNKAATPKKEKEATSEKTKVRMMYWNKEETMESFLKLAKEKLPNVDIEFNFVAVDQFNGTLDTQMQAGEGPDILPKGEAENYIKAGYLMDLTNEDFMKKYSKASLDSIAYEGKVYGLPGISWFEGIFYNKEIFEKHGIQIPKTFDEMMEVHKKLKEAGVKPQAWGAKSWEPFAKSPLGLATVDYLQADAGKTFDLSIKKGEGKFADSELKNIFEKWTQYFKDGYVTADMLQIDYDTALKQFATGEVAMWESGPWSVNAILETNPNLKFDMMPFVGTKPGNEHLIGGPGVCFGVNANSDKKEAAMEVIKLMATPEGQQALCAGSPGSGSFYEGANIKMPEQFNGVSEVLNKGNVYCPWFVWKGGDAYNEALGKGMQEVLQGNMTVDEVLKVMDQKVEEQKMQMK
ncbi:MAG: extracellular solute-binding protein [Lachnospiraceae bacterium]|nr:extracellular solute-binding protein [Lachnospiraceae bacterium]MDY5742962.1 extracellular solute-binding protein [Lachnospiraceae bacterium]